MYEYIVFAPHNFSRCSQIYSHNGETTRIRTSFNAPLTVPIRQTGAQKSCGSEAKLEDIGIRRIRHLPLSYSFPHRQAHNPKRSDEKPLCMREFSTLTRNLAGTFPIHHMKGARR